ncbi:MAG: hypothetical protein OXC14_15335, partial [Rhodospirillaceae bacterium]|nr:hypothetical protein [Rhodospirillaceae bacterium]
AAQRGNAAEPSNQVTGWFGHEPPAGAVLKKLDEPCRESDDAAMRAFVRFLLLPRAVTKTVGDGSDGYTALQASD